MPDRAAIIAAARACLDTPFRHQGRLPGQGLDCIGLVRWPAVACGLTREDFRAYGRQPRPEAMHRQLCRYFDPVPLGEARPGDILWLAVGDAPQHLAILTEVGTLIHALADGPGRVVEHGYRHPWPGRLRGVFRYRGLADG